MYSENMAKRGRTRPYRKRKRARSEEATRRRITEAAVELHGTIGPAKTTVTDIAERAGVSRMTVYNHFPTEQELFVSCSTHWSDRNPFPEPTLWSGIRDPAERLTAGLGEMYGWYAQKRGMLENVLRDERSMPSVARVMDELWRPYLEELVGALVEGWSEAPEDSPAVRAALRLVVDFETWRLFHEMGLDVARSVHVAVRMVRGAAGRHGRAAE